VSRLRHPTQRPPALTAFHALGRATLQITALLIQVEADGNAISGISAVEQIISITVVVHVDVIAVIPIAGPVFWPRVNQTEPIPAVLEPALPTNIHHGETVDAELMRLAIGATETAIRNSIAVVTTTLLPGAMLRLPTLGTIPLPSDLLLMYLRWASLLGGPVVLLLTLLILLPSGLLLPRRVALLLTLLLLLLIVLPRGLLLILFCRVVLLLPLLALLILLPSSLLLLLR